MSCSLALGPSDNTASPKSTTAMAPNGKRPSFLSALMVSAFWPSRYILAEFSAMALPVGLSYKSLTDCVTVTALPPYFRNRR
ncbi:Uncharacterised protein [Vibrio cholerae]|nr:Uncharacterised protein [Vibrio cholerae]